MPFTIVKTVYLMATRITAGSQPDPGQEAHECRRR
jgi:hypothetical protein